MAFHNHHKAFHGVGKRDAYDPAYDNKYRYIHLGGKDIDNPDTAAPTDSSDEFVTTIVSKIYVTEPKTFPGPAVYVTQTPVTTETLGAPAVTTHSQNSYESAKSVINQPKTRSSAADSFPTAMKGTPLSHPDYISQQSKGMSGGEKAGVAIGVLAAIGLVAGLILFCIRRRKKQNEERGEKLDEKHASQNSFFSGTAAAFGSPAGNKRESVKSFKSNHTAATAPRLSLRPVTEFLPGILENRKDTGNNNSLSVPPMSEKPRSASPQNPFEDGDAATAAAVPIASGATPKSNANNVHRVQLDFKPSMDDELELKSGQLVRMLHEYDDGWALCIRMDRTQQGVCPRTCLSKLPVKPRPQGPSPQGRPSGSPPGFHGPPQGANKLMPRPLTPTGRERSSTAGGRSESPSPLDGGRRRSQSVSAASDRSISPIDSGVPARKPVPGQAI